MVSEPPALASITSGGNGLKRSREDISNLGGSTPLIHPTPHIPLPVPPEAAAGGEASGEAGGSTKEAALNAASSGASSAASSGTNSGASGGADSGGGGDIGDIDIEDVSSDDDDMSLTDFKKGIIEKRAKMTLQETAGAQFAAFVEGLQHERRAGPGAEATGGGACGGEDDEGTATAVSPDSPDSPKREYKLPGGIVVPYHLIRTCCAYRSKTKETHGTKWLNKAGQQEMKEDAAAAEKAWVAEQAEQGGEGDLGKALQRLIDGPSRRVRTELKRTNGLGCRGLPADMKKERNDGRGI